MTIITGADAPRSTIDPFSLEAMQDPHRYDGELRELGPVVYLEKWGIYAITQYAEIQKALRNWRTFSSTGRPFYKPNPFRPTILVLEDPPGHTQSKNSLMKLFSEENLAVMESEFDAEADRIVEELLASGPADIDAYKDLSARFVLKVFPDALGLPEEGREHLLQYGDAVFNTMGPDGDFKDAKFANAAKGLDWVESNTVREMQKEGKLGWQVFQMADEGEFSEEFAQQMLKSIFSAGFDTTVAGIAGLLRALADHPAEFEKLRSDPSLVPNAWEESIRYYPPARFAGRITQKDVEVGGVNIPADSEVVLLVLASGREEGKYDNPNEFRVDRDLSKGHLSFGFGIHTCGGQAIARLEGRAILKALVKHVGKIELTGEPRQSVNFQAFGHEYVPVRLHPAS